MKQPIAHPEWIADAVAKMEQSCRMDREGTLPASIRGFMLAAPAKRLLRCIHGNSNIRVGWIILLDGLKLWWGLRWFNMRAKCGLMWLNKDEREVMDAAWDDEARP